jgi:hypothetical protein
VSVSRLAGSATEVSWIEKGSVLVGFIRCDHCDVESPPPTTDQIIAFCQKRGSGHTVWMGDQGFEALGWEHILDKDLCPTCVCIVEAALRNDLLERPKHK